MNNVRIQKIREILLKDWDPFAVGDNPNLADEYDGFIASIAHLIENHSSFEMLSQRLIQIEKELHAPVSDEQRAKAIKALHSLS